jgi:hypothetical protein
MNREALRQFLLDSNKAGYAGGDEKAWRQEEDGSTTISYERDGWSLHDNFFGGEPYGGRTIVFYEARPVWMMAYYGWVAQDHDASLVYGVLRRALMHMPETHPFRGPAEWSEDEFVYRNAWHGEVERFTGNERILQGTDLIYEASYSGGVVDRRRGV